MIRHAHADSLHNTMPVAIRLAVVILGYLLLPVSSARAADQPAGFDQSVLPFFQTYCLRCHNAEKQKGEFRLDTLSRDFADLAIAQRWGEVVFRMNSGEMPPKKEPQPKPDELGRAVEWISA